MTVAQQPLRRLATEIRGHGGLIAPTVVDAPAGASLDGVGALAAAGPRAAEHREEYALLVETIHEGYLLHYGTPRVVRPEDPDLALLAGDRLYALGLSRLADLGDLDAVAELADVISLAAQAHAEGDPDRAEAAWRAGAGAVGSGPTADHQAAKRAWRRAG